MIKSECSGRGQSLTNDRLSDWLAHLCKLAETFEQAEKRLNETRTAFIEAENAFEAVQVTLQFHYRRLPDQHPMTNATLGKINRIAAAWLRRRNRL